MVQSPHANVRVFALPCLLCAARGDVTRVKHKRHMQMFVCLLCPALLCAARGDVARVKRLLDAGGLENPSMLLPAHPSKVLYSMGLFEPVLAVRELNGGPRRQVGHA